MGEELYSFLWNEWISLQVLQGRRANKGMWNHHREVQFSTGHSVDERAGHNLSNTTLIIKSFVPKLVSVSDFQKRNLKYLNWGERKLAHFLTCRLLQLSFYNAHHCFIISIYTGLPRKLREANCRYKPFPVADPCPLYKNVSTDLAWPYFNEAWALRLQ